MKRDADLFIDDILKSIINIEDFAKNLDKERFMKDDLRQNAIIRQLEIIGEAVKNIPQSFKEKYFVIPWKNIAGFRDILTHRYFSVSIERIFDIIKKDLPALKKEITKIKKDISKR